MLKQKQQTDSEQTRRARFQSEVRGVYVRGDESTHRGLFSTQSICPYYPNFPQTLPVTSHKPLPVIVTILRGVI